MWSSEMKSIYDYPEILQRVVGLLDYDDLVALTCTSFKWRGAAIDRLVHEGRTLLHQNNVNQNNVHQSQNPTAVVTAANFSANAGRMLYANAMSMATTGFASSSGSDNDTLDSTDTELDPAEEDRYFFKLTPEVIKRIVSHLGKGKGGPAISRLPTELHLQVFSYLDPIDATCLGLSSPNSYAIYREIYGIKMPLNTRRSGPNALEAAWEVVGKQECNYCGVYRCELHRHIKSWMPKELEYCTMKRNFGLPAGDEAKSSCYRGKPSKPRRCGRHPVRTTTIHQDDAQYNP